MKGRVLLGTALSVGLLFSVIPQQQAFAAKNVLSEERYNKKKDSLEFKAGNLSEPSSEKAEDILLAFFEKNKNAYKIGKKKAKDSFIIQKQSTDELGNTILKLQQTFEGVPVWGSTQAAVIDKKGVLTVVSGTVEANLEDKLGKKSKRVSVQQKLLSWLKLI